MCNPLPTHKPPWETRRIDAGKVGKEEADLKDEFRMKALIIKKLMPRSKKKKRKKRKPDTARLQTPWGSDQI